jgi:hypothetical protein
MITTKGHSMTRPTTYLPTPADAPVVTVYDLETGQDWQGVVVDGIVHDASGILDPDDIGWRFTIECDGVDITARLAAEFATEFAGQTEVAR